MKPGIIPLRPLGLGEILDGAFTTMRRYPKATLGLSAAVAAITAAVDFTLQLATRDVVSTSFNDGSADFEFSGVALAVGLLSFLLSVLAGLVLSGMLIVVIGEAVLGKPVDIGAVWNRVRPRIGALIGVSILVMLAIVAVILAFTIPSVLLAFALDSPAFAVIGILLCIPAAIYLGVGLSLTTPALILEGQSATNAMRRSRALVAGSWWRVFGILLLGGIIAGIVASVIAAPFTFGAQVPMGLSGDPFRTPSVGELLLQSIGTILSSTVSSPISAGVGALLYIDRRMRREGLDVALARTAAAGVPAPPGAPPQGPSSGW
jgi:hypothetical protein